jgi:hypothetical protein
LKEVTKEGIIFIKGIPDSHIRIEYDQYLYNRPEFIKLISGKLPEVFYAYNRDHRIIAGCSFTIHERSAFSPFRGPFGSIEMDSSVSVAVLVNFLSYINDELHKSEVDRIVVKNYAGFQALAIVDKITEAFLLSGYDRSSVDINHHIDIKNNDFKSLIHPMEQRRLVKCKKAGMKVRKAKLDEYGCIHDFIRICRKEKELEININKQDFLETTRLFPEQYHVFVGLIEDKVVAATVCVAVNHKILYNYLPASIEEYKAFSPMVMIMESVYNYAKMEQYSFIDLGISSINGVPQKGLIQFKERIGGVFSEKTTFRKILKG